MGRSGQGKGRPIVAVFFWVEAGNENTGTKGTRERENEKAGTKGTRERENEKAGNKGTRERENEKAGNEGTRKRSCGELDRQELRILRLFGREF